MFFGIGALTVILCVFGGYAAMGGNLSVLWQPFEYVIIIGAAIGAYVIANPKSVIIGTGSAFKSMMGGSPYKKDHFIELLSVMYVIFKLARNKGALALEAHVEAPEESAIFSHFKHFSGQHHALVFFCDYLRLLTLGGDNPHQIEDLLNEEIEVHHEEDHKISAAVQGMADGMPALGIVAAVLGVIKTMGAISQPPEVLGKYIGGALVGTFVGVFVAYGFLGPVAHSIGSVKGEEGRYLLCIKSGLMAYLNGYAPALCVEFARKSLLPEVRPSFYEVETAVSELPNLE